MILQNRKQFKRNLFNVGKRYGILYAYFKKNLTSILHLIKNHKQERWLRYSGWTAWKVDLSCKNETMPKKAEKFVSGLLTPKQIFLYKGYIFKELRGSEVQKFCSCVTGFVLIPPTHYFPDAPFLLCRLLSAEDLGLSKSGYL